MPQTQITNKEYQIYEYYAQQLLEASIIENNKVQPINQQEPAQKIQTPPKL